MFAGQSDRNADSGEEQGRKGKGATAMNLEGLLKRIFLIEFTQWVAPLCPRKHRAQLGHRHLFRTDGPEIRSDQMTDVESV